MTKQDFIPKEKGLQGKHFPISACCNASVKVVSQAGGTTYYVCLACDNACDLAEWNKSKVEMTLKGYPEKKEFITPKNYKNNDKNSEIVGFNEAIDLFTKEIIERSEVEKILEIIKLSCTSQLYLLKHKEFKQVIKDMRKLAMAISTLIREGK